MSVVTGNPHWPMVKGMGKFCSSHATVTAGLRTSHANRRTDGTPPRRKPGEFCQIRHSARRSAQKCLETRASAGV
jgi:hypothetical protein